MTDVTDKIAKLLRQAEHKNTSPEEADAFYAKAQALMTQYSIDMLTVRAKMTATDADPLGALGQTILTATKSYLLQDAILADGIAKANDCRVQYSKDSGTIYVYGYETDRLNVQLLYTSMSIVVSQQALVYGKQSGLAGMKLYIARRSFRGSFAQRIGQRLQAAKTTVVAAAGNNLLPAIASKVDAVEKYMPRGRSSRSKQSYDWQAGAAGKAAADKADIGGMRLGAKTRGAIG